MRRKSPPLAIVIFVVVVVVVVTLLLLGNHKTYSDLTYCSLGRVHTICLPVAKTLSHGKKKYIEQSRSNNFQGIIYSLPDMYIYEVLNMLYRIGLEKVFVWIQSLICNILISATPYIFWHSSYQRLVFSSCYLEMSNTRNRQARQFGTTL